jgi:CheY-like chemotaxis protein
MQGNESSLSVSTPLIPGGIPLKLSRQFVPPRANEAIRSSILKDPSSETLKRKRHALVVDDVPDVTDMLSVLLTHAGYEVTTADNAFAAIDAASQRQFDVVISDIGMPEMNGYELARRLRVLPGYECIPMVAVTGYSMFDDHERSLSAGFNAHVTKPIEPRTLLDLIEQL